MKNHENGLSPLLLQNSYSKFDLTIKKTLSVDRFKNKSSPITPIEIVMLSRKYFSCPPKDNSTLKLILRCQILHISSSVVIAYLLHLMPVSSVTGGYNDQLHGTYSTTWINNALSQIQGQIKINQRTNGPVNAHLISWPSKAQNIQHLENLW